MTRTRVFLTGFSLTLLAALAADPARAARVEQGNLILDGIPARDAALSERVARYLDGRQATFMDWLPDGSMLVQTRFGDTAQVHRVRGPLMQREQLTFNKDPVGYAAAAPYSADFVYLRDKGGDENTQIYLQKGADGSVRLLTDGKSLHGPPRWAHDGKRIAFHSNARDGASYDVYVLDTTIATPPRLLLGGQPESWYVLDWSLDDTRLLVLRYVSAAESYLGMLDVASGKVTPVEPAGGEAPAGGGRKRAKGGAAPAKVAVTDAKFAADGRGIVMISDHGGEFAELRYVDMFSGAQQTLSPALRWDVERFDVSRDGRYVAYVVNEAGFSRLTILDNQTRSELTPPGLPAGLIASLGFDREGKRLALSVETAQAARDVYVYELAGGALARWTQSEMGPIDPAHNVPAELIRFPTWDRVGNDFRQLAAFVYRPRTPGPHPVLINIHGGPESQYRPGYDAFIQFAVNELGYAVVAPNVRGSSGYGRAFLALDDGRLREDSVRDIGSLLAWIGAQSSGGSTLDRNRIVVMGGSYGGYMTLASLVQYGDRLAGGVDTVGISNFVTFLEKTSAYRRDLRREEYGDERNPDVRSFLQRISPLTNAQSIKKPLLIVQGINDPRVPASESEQMLLRVRANGGDAWYLAAKDEGHGFRKKGNRDFYLETVAAFLARFAPPVPGAP